MKVQVNVCIRRVDGDEEPVRGTMTGESHYTATHTRSFLKDVATFCDHSVLVPYALPIRYALISGVEGFCERRLSSMFRNPGAGVQGDPSWCLVVTRIAGIGARIRKYYETRERQVTVEHSGVGGPVASWRSDVARIVEPRVPSPATNVAVSRQRLSHRT